jgi:hypothetical protein
MTALELWDAMLSYSNLGPHPAFTRSQKGPVRLVSTVYRRFYIETANGPAHQVNQERVAAAYL